MAALNYNISKRTRTLVQLALFSAIIILMGFTPLGFLKVGVVEITFLVIPVAIGAIMLGQLGGAILGGVFGLVSFFQCFGYSAFGTLLFGINPFFTFVICFIPRVLMGWLTGLIFELILKAFRKRSKGNTVPCILAALICPLLNTILFVGVFVLLFGRNAEVLAIFNNKGIWGIIIGLVTVNAAIEAGVSFLIGSAVAKALSHFLPKPVEHKKPNTATVIPNDTDKNEN